MNDKQIKQIEAEINSMQSLRSNRDTLQCLPLPNANSAIWSLGHGFVAQIYAAADGSDNAAIVWLKNNGVK